MKKLLASFVIISALAACTSSGNESIRAESNETISSKIKKGSTTKNQVKAALGDPSTISFTDSGNEQWTYKHDIAKPKPINFVPYASLIASGADVESKTLVIFFNKAGIVQNYTISESKQEVRRGLGAM